MAAARHTLTRRALLGAAVGACAIAAAPSAAGAHRTRWDQALAEFRHAEAHLAALPRGASDAASDERECAWLDALRQLMCTPAPDLPALRLKIELTVDEDVATLIDAETCLAALRADAQRLLRGG